MSKRKEFPIGVWAACLMFLLMAVLLIYANGGDQANLAFRRPFPVWIVGEYRVDGGGWEPLSPDAEFSADDYHTVTVRGHFSDAVPAGEELLFPIYQLVVRLRIGGEEVWTNANDARPAFLSSPGISWCAYPSPGITVQDEVELLMSNAYKGVIPSFRDLLDHMEVGRRSQLYAQMIDENGYVLLAAGFAMLLGLSALTLALVAKLCGLPQASKAAALALFGVIAGLYILSDSNHIYIPLIFPSPSLASMCDILSLYLLPPVLSLLMLSYAGPDNRRLLAFLTEGLCGAVAGMILLQLFGVLQLYEHQRVLMGVSILTLPLMFASLLRSCLRHRDRETTMMVLTTLPLFSAMILGALDFVFIPFLPPRIAVQLGAGITLSLQAVQIVHMIRMSSRARTRSLELERELAESRMEIMLSQIQPHFLYNSLTAIRQLCRSNPAQATEAVGEFARFLRGNMDSLTCKTPIAFSQELEHVKSYLALEERRFSDTLHVAYDIRCSDFSLPALTLQPLVENAVRHGVTAREGGGAVTIRAEETARSYQITISDDGVGFDPSAPLERDGGCHVGIENVRCRLRELSGGTLEIRSAPGAGTVAVISLPKGGTI